MARRNRYTSSFILAGLVMVASLLALWSIRRVPDSVREERQGKLLPALRRALIVRVEIESGGERFAVAKDNGHWALVEGTRRFEADEPEVERVLTEAEFAAPSRRLGTLDAASRERFGLTTPRARVTLREEQANAQTFEVGGLVAAEQSVYVAIDREGFVVPKSLADAFVRRATDLRDRTLSQLDPARLRRLELDGEGGHRVLEQADGTWRLTTPSEGRVSRARIESLLHDLRDLRATRFLAETADAAALARYGLTAPRLTLRAVRAPGTPVLEWRFGAACESYVDEVTVARNDSPAVACVGRAVFDNANPAPSDLRDNKIVWARPDEVERVRVHAASEEFSAVRDRDHWRLDGATGEADSDAIEAWLTTLGGMSAETRGEGATAAAHGLAPATAWIEISRTGVDGSERLNIGVPDADRMYVQRSGELAVLGLDPSTADNLRIDAARFRSRRIVRDVPDELAALVTETPSIRDEAMRVDGTWRLTRPFEALADPTVVRAASQRLATLDAERWVALTASPQHGLASPRLRAVARFDGPGPDPEPGDGGTSMRDASRARVREYTLTVGAAAAGGGFYASISGRPGVFVLAQTAVDELSQPHVDRNIAEIDRTAVERIELRRGAPLTSIVLVRDGDVWRSDRGAPADRTRVGALLDRLALIRALNVFGYGPPPPDARLGSSELTVTLAAAPAGDAATTAPGPRVIHLTLGATVGSGSEAGVYARREGIDATFSIPRDVADALRDFVP